MTKLVCLRFITILFVGLVWPVYGQDTDDIWLNEIYVDYNEEVRVSVEVIGRPKDSGADAPRQMGAALTFFGPQQETTGAVLNVVLTASDKWGENYLATALNKLGYEEAFDEEEVAGVVLSYTAQGVDVEKTYCWGEGANGSSTIDGGKKTCEVVVRPTTMYVSANGESRGSGLYGGTEGEAESAFIWAASTTAVGGGPSDFSTIGDVNTCEDYRCTHSPQSIKDWSFTDVTEVWLNEVDFEDGEVSIEMVARPAEAADVSVSVRFYLGDDAKGAAATTATLVPDSKFAGNYALHMAVTGVDDAFPSSGALAGLVLTGGSSVPIVYCWGTGAADNDASIGGEFPCGRTVRSSAFISDGSFNSGLYNKEAGGAQGVKEKDFKWEESKHTSEASFSTLGDINSCKEACGLEAQVLAPYEEQQTPESDNDDVVWLNELDVIGHLDSPVCMMEFVGRPVRVNGEDPPDSIEAVITFYDGSAKIGNDETVTLTSKSEDEWEGNYVGSFKDDSSTPGYSGAFPRQDKVTGVKVVHGKETRVYCWGLNAKVDDAIDGADVKCQSIVTNTNINGENGQTNFAMWSKADDSTPSSGGTKGGDFEWLSSEYGTGGAFDTIDKVNACPTGQACGDLKNQVLAKYDWTVNDVVWINEVNVSGVSDSASPSVAIEFAARPRRTTGDPPSSIDAKLTFYDGTVSMEEMSVKLSPQSSGGWKGNYVGVMRDDETLSKAFPRGGIGGVEVVYQHEARVYCWGDDAKVGSVVGDITTKCEIVVSDKEMNVSEEQRNMAMWNRDGDAYEGRGGSDFQWKRSVDDDEKDFATIGEVNVCSACGDLNDQVLAEFDWKAVEIAPSSTTTRASSAVARRGVAVVGLAAVIVLNVL